MKHLPRTAIIVTALIGVLILVGCTVWRPIGDITIRPVALSHSVASEGLEHARPEIQVSAYVTGWVKAPANILIDQGSPLLPDHLKQAQWVPSVAYTIRHPEKGIVVLDTGLRAGACDYGLRPIYWVPCRNTPGSDLVSQLKAAGIQPNDIRYIIPSHFHGDHISGLEALLDYSEAPLLVMQASLDEIGSPLRAVSGIPSHMLKADMHVIPIDSYLVETPLLGQSFDVFGDRSLVMFATSGHSGGHLSALLRTSANNFLFTFDASHLSANLELSIPSGSVSSKIMAANSLARLRQIAGSLGSVDILFGHEPKQWDCVTRRVDISEGLPSCAS